ncbi:MAG: glycosyltransferase [Microgenomates group bacterium]
MNLLLLVKNIDGGTGKFIIDLYSILNRYWAKKNGNTLHIICLEKPHFRKLRLFKTIKYIHPKKYYESYYKLNGRILSLFLSEVTTLNNLLKLYNSDIAIGIDIHSNFLLIINKLLNNNKLRVICTTHIDLLQTIKSKASYPLMMVLKSAVKMLYAQADYLIGCSNGVSKQLERDFKLKRNSVHTIYLGVKKPTKNILRNRNRKTFTFATVGRLEEQKSIDTIISALNLLNGMVDSPVLLRIIGDGTQRSELIKQVSSLRLSEQVIFRGWRQNIERELINTDAFILSSKREGFPYVLLEALSVGLPIISSNVPYGPSEILKGGKYGVLVPMQNAEALAEKMYELVTSKRKYSYYANKSIERSNFFTLDKMADSYMKVLRNFEN